MIKLYKDKTFDNYYVSNKEKTNFRHISLVEGDTINWDIKDDLPLREGEFMRLIGEGFFEIPLKDLPRKYINNLTNLEYIQLKAQENNCKQINI